MKGVKAKSTKAFLKDNYKKHKLGPWKRGSPLVWKEKMSRRIRAVAAAGDMNPFTSKCKNLSCGKAT